MAARKNYLPLMILPLTIIAGVLFYYFKLQTGQKTALSETVQSRGESKSVLDQTLNKFKLKGFDPAGEANWELEGENAQIDPGQSVILDENVTLKLRDNTIIRTDHVNWSQGGGVLRTESVVTVDHENAKVRGRGAYGRPNEGYIQLNRDIEMTINYTTNLVCQGPLKIFYNLNKMEFYRKVKVTDTRGTLSASRMDVMFDPETKKIKEIIAMGTVIIKRGEDTTRSNRAIYSVETGSIRLEGNPEVTLKKGSGGILDGALRNQRVEKIL